MTHLTFTALAEEDLEAIGDYIATDNPARAASFIQELRVQCQRIAANPPGYHLRPELGDDIRSCAHGHYVIFFVAAQEDVTIVRILHGARDIPAILAPDDHGQ
ncbi:type II toxin-antitoxin system RelE/ParE family toxin [Acidiferrobacter sp.]|uniref:type II toxin-antitoxin system RelE/ParE family toxin n=1 Tax=Acidiferrobacter sp. TaxID=1872107 RepID=UPI00262AA50C|nr:type II toxin-antitoxin system RelE/ParE family toxin [Acidiferrobacter sp.]